MWYVYIVCHCRRRRCRCLCRTEEKRSTFKQHVACWSASVEYRAHRFHYFNTHSWRKKKKANSVDEKTYGTWCECICKRDRAWMCRYRSCSRVNTFVRHTLYTDWVRVKKTEREREKKCCQIQMKGKKKKKERTLQKRANISVDKRM